MAFNQVTAASLTPSRPAPAAPGRNGQSGYGSSFAVGTSSPSGSSYAASYSGIGGSPNRLFDTPSNSEVVRAGTVNVKEDGLVSFLWRPKWLILKDTSLSIHKSEVCAPLHCALLLRYTRIICHLHLFSAFETAYETSLPLCSRFVLNLVALYRHQANLNP